MEHFKVASTTDKLLPAVNSKNSDSFTKHEKQNLRNSRVWKNLFSLSRLIAGAFNLHSNVRYRDNESKAVGKRNNEKSLKHTKSRESRGAFSVRELSDRKWIKINRIDIDFFLAFFLFFSWNDFFGEKLYGTMKSVDVQPRSS